MLLKLGSLADFTQVYCSDKKSPNVLLFRRLITAHKCVEFSHAASIISGSDWQKISRDYRQDGAFVKRTWMCEKIRFVHFVLLVPLTLILLKSMINVMLTP